MADSAAVPDALQDRRFYEPSDQGYEAQIKARLEQWRVAE